VNDQWLSGRMQLCCLIDGKRKSFRHREPAVIFAGSILGRIEHPHRRRVETFFIFFKRNTEPVAIRGCLFMGERQSSESFRQSLGGGTLGHVAGAGNEIIGADLFRPKRQFQGLPDAAPSMGV
jgi:hypothetical protein